MVSLLPEQEAGLLINIIQFSLLRQQATDKGIDLPLVADKHPYKRVTVRLSPL